MYGILFSGFMYMMSKTPRTFGERVIKIAMIQPQDESTQKQIAKTEPIKEKVEEKQKEEPIQKIEKTKNPLASKPTPIKQQEVSKVEQSVKQQQVAQMAYTSSQAQKDQFISELKNKIRQNKHYPEAARRRGQEGTVEVSFCVSPDGSVSNIICNGEHSVLNGAAKDAVSKAFPIRVPPNVITTSSLELSLVLNYKLD